MGTSEGLVRDVSAANLAKIRAQYNRRYESAGLEAIGSRGLETVNNDELYLDVGVVGDGCLMRRNLITEED